MKTHCVILKSDDGSVSIVELPKGATHSRQIAKAPMGFKPGDEEFVFFISGHIHFDIKGKLKRDQEKKKSKTWNSDSPVDRIKKSILG